MKMDGEEYEFFIGQCDLEQSLYPLPDLAGAAKIVRVTLADHVAQKGILGGERFLSENTLAEEFQMGDEAAIIDRLIMSGMPLPSSALTICRAMNPASSSLSAAPSCSRIRASASQPRAYSAG